MDVDGIYCVWDWNPKPKKREGHWLHVKTAIASDGYCEGERVQCWPYMQMAVDGNESTEWMKGRLITCWTFLHGVALVEFSSPDRFAIIQPTGWDWLKKQQEWWQMIEGGYRLMHLTVEEIQKVLREKLT